MLLITCVYDTDTFTDTSSGRISDLFLHHKYKMTTIISTMCWLKQVYSVTATVYDLPETNGTGHNNQSTTLCC